MAPPNELNIPELRMIGTGPDRTWQWKFDSDGQWRDMMQTIDSTMKIDKSRQVTKMPGWVPLFGGMTLKKGPVIDVSGGGIFGGQSPLNKALEGLFPELGDQYVQSVVDFDILADKTNLLPSGFKANTSPEYLMAVAELWREVTGYNPTDGGQAAYYNLDQTYKTDVDGDSELFKIASDLVEDMGWRDVATVRGYELDWGDPNAITDFLNAAQDDFNRGVKYDDADSLANGQNPVGNIGSIVAEEELEAKLGLKRKVVGEFGEGAGNRTMANAAAAKIPNSKVEEIDGQWAITVPPGQGGFTSLDAGNAFIRDSGLDDTKWEMASSAEGEFVIREKKPEDTQGHDTVEAARAALEKTGADPEQYEYRTAQDGKVYPVYVGDPPAYSTPTRTVGGEVVPGIPGEMFEPTITEDPTGRQFGLTASGNITDFGYGMAGDITQEELAGYQVPSRGLDEIIAKAIEQGNWELARGVQAFKDRPTERDLLDYAAQFAEAPADLAVLSAIARGEQMVQPAVPLPEGMGTGMGQATRIGAPGEVYTAAYKTFLDSMNQGYVPNEDELRDLFDPKNDPAYIATQELANKYETQIGNLRNEIAEANKSASERIENNQTNTLNMMTGMFENTIKSFQDLMESSTSMQDTEIARLLEENKTLRTGTDVTGKDVSDVYKRQTERGAEGKSASNKRIEEWLAFNRDKYGITADVSLLEGKTSTEILEWLSDSSNWNQGTETAAAPAVPDPSAAATPGITSMATLPSGAMAPSTIVGGVGQYQKDPTQAQFADIVGDVPGQAATESQFVYQTADKDWFMAPPDKPAERSWQEKYFAPQVVAEQKAFETGQVDPYEFEGAEGGVVQGPTMALLGEKEPEFVVPFSKVDEFKRGFLPMGRPRQTRRGSTVANFTDSMPRFANGGLVTGPAERNVRFGGVTARGLEQYGDTGAYVTPETRAELELGAGGQYGANGISRAPRIGSSDFESLLTQYATPESQRYLREGTTALGQTGVRDEAARFAQMGNIPEYELRQRLGASEFAGANPTQHPIGIQQLMAGRPIARPRSLMTAANMPKPSGQALRNMLPSEIEYYQKMGRMAGIPQAELEQEMRSVMPGGTRRTPLRMGARRVRQT